MICSYCGYAHGIIGDVICPIPLATNDFYQRKHKPVFVTHQYYAPIRIATLIKIIGTGAVERKKHLSNLHIEVTDEETYTKVRERIKNYTSNYKIPAGLKKWEDAKAQSETS